MSTMTEDALEQTALSWLSDLSWTAARGPDLGPGGQVQEREDWRQTVLVDRLRDALIRINSTIPPDGIDKAVRQVLGIASPDLAVANRSFHRSLTDGIDVEVGQSWWP